MGQNVQGYSKMWYGLGPDVAIKRIKKGCFVGRALWKNNWVVPDGAGGTLATVTKFMANGSLRNVLVKKDRDFTMDGTELCIGNTEYPEKVDMFSFGITMWEILTDEEPYSNMHCGAINRGIE
ncbi:probable serine/threonine-protein kinase roco5 isoform X1 [Tanacetum coccineum]